MDVLCVECIDGGNVDGVDGPHGHGWHTSVCNAEPLLAQLFIITDC